MKSPSLENKYIFILVKLFFLGWTLVFAGTLEHYKANVIEEIENPIIAYTIFWTIFIGVGYLFKNFWEVKSVEQMKVVMGKVSLAIIMPSVALIYITLLLVFLAYGTLEAGFISIMFTMLLAPLFVITWVTKFRETGSLEAVKIALKLD
ncbi:MAG: hypothetical protein MJK12_17550 [Colwellia sp.]|nr:hypothetical protein [Colwellia sp.]